MNKEQEIREFVSKGLCTEEEAERMLSQLDVLEYQKKTLDFVNKELGL